MQLILLSGGSGKRLWPLSNNARSKQFLPVLEAPDGGLESMLCRVVRQIRCAGLDCAITIATNASQKDIIVNQLGDGVDIVTEPERRDTFPAIALACSYLKRHKKCADDEVVVIMPCDPYTESGYFVTIGRMIKAVMDNEAELVLMGITPDCPSSKFGYVVPQSSDAGKQVQKVLRFTEKPDKATAEELLRQHAFWNGGVFAFKLGYMMKIAEEFVKDDDFETIRSKYSSFPKISFDYQVAEKAASVSVVPFTGSWKDLGTWNSLSGELARHVIGNAFLGPDNINTHVINELGIPIFVNGMENTVVAASADGILVCSKEHSEGIKSYVDNLGERPMYEERRWGTYKVLESKTYKDGFKSLTKTINLKEGKSISYQVHHHREEVWTFVEGTGELIVDGVHSTVGRGDVVVIRKGQKHAVKAVTPLTFIEVQSGDKLVEEDIVRLEMDFDKII